MPTSTGNSSATPMPYTEHPPAGSITPTGSLAIWLLSDGKPGHEAQLQGLGQALSRRQPVELTWINVADRRASWAHLLRGRYPGLTTRDTPQLAIGAGHGTHRQLLTLARASGCMSCVLMRPSLPLRWFDAAIIPRHDLPPRRRQVLVTEGVLNPIEPAQSTDSTRGLILLGGPSRHCHFPIDDVCARIELLCGHFAKVQWTASTSRRTPDGMAAALKGRTVQNLQVTEHTDTPPGWVAQMLSCCSQAWITEDSVSMVYEALSAGLATGLIPLPAVRAGRLQRGVAYLYRDNRLNRLNQILAGQSPQRPSQPLQEAARAADWLLQRLSDKVRA